MSRRRHGNVYDIAEMLLGKLSPDQLEMLRVFLKNNPDRAGMLAQSMLSMVVEKAEGEKEPPIIAREEPLHEKDDRIIQAAAARRIRNPIKDPDASWENAIKDGESRSDDGIVL